MVQRLVALPCAVRLVLYDLFQLKHVPCFACRQLVSPKPVAVCVTQIPELCIPVPCVKIVCDPITSPCALHRNAACSELLCSPYKVRFRCEGGFDLVSC